VVRDTPITFALTGTDADNDALAFTPLDPAHGTLTGTPSHLTYTPHRGFVGTDSFLFTASDGLDQSAPALIELAVVSTNHPPTAVAQIVIVPRNQPVVIRLTGTDEENTPLGSRWQQPSTGSLVGYGSPVVYRPARNFVGLDSFTFAVSDGDAVSSPATVTVIVKAGFPSMDSWRSAAQ
jgi:hypothetical protein